MITFNRRSTLLMWTCIYFGINSHAYTQDVAASTPEWEYGFLLGTASSDIDAASSCYGFLKDSNPNSTLTIIILREGDTYFGEVGDILSSARPTDLQNEKVQAMIHKASIIWKAYDEIRGKNHWKSGTETEERLQKLRIFLKLTENK